MSWRLQDLQVPFCPALLEINWTWPASCHENVSSPKHLVLSCLVIHISFFDIFDSKALHHVSPWAPSLLEDMRCLLCSKFLILEGYSDLYNFSSSDFFHCVLHLGFGKFWIRNHSKTKPLTVTSIRLEGVLLEKLQCLYTAWSEGISISQSRWNLGFGQIKTKSKLRTKHVLFFWFLKLLKHRWKPALPVEASSFDSTQRWKSCDSCAWLPMNSFVSVHFTANSPNACHKEASDSSNVTRLLANLCGMTLNGGEVLFVQLPRKHEASGKKPLTNSAILLPPTGERRRTQERKWRRSFELPLSSLSLSPQPLPEEAIVVKARPLSDSKAFTSEALLTQKRNP